MNTEDQEKIYSLYENFRNIELTQPSSNLTNLQHPNYISHLSTSNTWRGITGPGKPDRLSQEQEENESKFKYKDRQGNMFGLVKISNDIAYLRDAKTGIIIEIPLKKLHKIFKEV